jgi:hypothetical protein
VVESENGVERVDTLPVGSRVGSCEIRRVAARSSYGVVYEGVDTATGERLAIKEYLPAGLTLRHGAQVEPRGPSVAALFERGRMAFLAEAQTLARLRHPALLPVLRVWEAHGTAYRTMPWIEAESLTALRRSMPAPPDGAALRELLEDLLGALETLHADGVVHGAIAPDKILIGASDHPVLLDHSAVRHAVVSESTSAIAAGLLPSFEAPEQLAGERIGPWTDLYSLALVTLFALSGRLPRPALAANGVRSARFEPVEQMVRQLQAEHPGLEVDPALRATLRAALADDPAARPDSVTAFRALLAGEPYVPALEPSAAGAELRAAEAGADSGTTRVADPPIDVAADTAPRHAELADLDRLLSRVARRARDDAAGIATGSGWPADSAAAPLGGPEPAAAVPGRAASQPAPFEAGAAPTPPRRALWVGAALAVAAVAMLAWLTSGDAPPPADRAAQSASGPVLAASESAPSWQEIASAPVAPGPAVAAAPSDEAPAAARAAPAVPAPPVAAPPKPDPVTVAAAPAVPVAAPPTPPEPAPAKAVATTPSPVTVAATRPAVPAPPAAVPAPAAASPKAPAAAAPPRSLVQAPKAAENASTKNGKTTPKPAAPPSTKAATPKPAPTAAAKAAVATPKPAAQTPKPAPPASKATLSNGAPRKPEAAEARNAPSTPRAVCGERTPFSLYRCMQSTCAQARWQVHPQCVKLRETDQVD